MTLQFSIRDDVRAGAEPARGTAPVGNPAPDPTLAFTNRVDPYLHTGYGCIA